MEAREAYRCDDAKSAARGFVAALLPRPMSTPMITVPDTIWKRMIDEFSAEKRAVEQVAYIDGIVFEDAELTVATATTLTIPNAVLDPGRFEVSADAMSQAGKHFRRFKMQRLAQVHTHPTDWVGHSGWDDKRAYSQIPGAISIVLPNFARNRPDLAQSGVHLRTQAGWRQLSQEEKAQRIRSVPGYLDFRHHEPKIIITPRGRRWWHSLAFWRN